MKVSKAKQKKNTDLLVLCVLLFLHCLTPNKIIVTKPCAAILFIFPCCCWFSTACEPVSFFVFLPSSFSLKFTSWCEARPSCRACCLFTPIQGIHLRCYSSNKFTQQPMLSRDLSPPSLLAHSLFAIPSTSVPLLYSLCLFPFVLFFYFTCLSFRNH